MLYFVFYGVQLPCGIRERNWHTVAVEPEPEDAVAEQGEQGEAWLSLKFSDTIAEIWAKLDFVVKILCRSRTCALLQY